MKNQCFIQKCLITAFMLPLFNMSLPHLATVQAAIPQALNHASAQSQVIFVIPNMAQLSNELAVFKQTYNLPIPELDDALGTFKAETGMVEGVNDEGALIVILPDLTGALVEDKKPDFVLLMPVSDYDQFIRNFEGTSEDDIATLLMPDGKTGFAKQIEDYAVLGENKLVVENYTPAENAESLAGKAGWLGKKYLNESEIALYFDIEAIAPTLLPKVDEAISMVQQELAASAGMGVTPDLMESANVIYNMYGDALKAVLEDATAVVLGLDISSSGIAINQAVQFRAESDLANMFPGGTIQPVELLKELPDNSYIFAGAADMTACNVVQLVDNIMAAMPEDGQGDGMLAIYKESLPLMKSTLSWAGAFYAPDPMAMMSGQMLNMVQAYRVENGEEYIVAYKNQIEQMNELSIPMGAQVGDEPVPMLKYNTSFRENALQIDDIAIHEYQFTMDIPPEMIMQMGPAALMMTNIGGYIAAKDNHVVLTTVMDLQLITEGLKAITGKNGISSTGMIAQVRSNLPPNLAFEGYINLKGIADAVNVYLAVFLPEPLMVPDDIPPFAMGMGIKDNGMAFTFYAPNTTIKYISDSVQNIQQDIAEQQQMMMQMEMEDDMPEDWMQEESEPEQDGPPSAPR